MSNADENVNEYIVILCCGCSLTLCLLTLISLLWHFFMDKKCGITLMHAQVAFNLALLMVAIILKIAKFLHDQVCLKNLWLFFKNNLIQFQLDDGISLCLHYLFSSSLVCQINIFAALLSEISWPYRLYHQFKSFLFFLSFIIPALYTGIIAHLQQSLPISIPTHLPDQVRITSKNWLVSLSGNQFQAFLSMNLIFMTLYLVLFIKLVRALREKTENPIKNQHQR